jgi:hypothetical protein
VRTKIIEANHPINWGKFMLGVWDAAEWRHPSGVHPEQGFGSLLNACGWTRDHFMLFDLQTGEGAVFIFNPTGLARADLEKHRVWVCPQFEPFLAWLYKQPREKVLALDLPSVVDLDGPGEMYGYRRGGEPEPEPGGA